jgi:signal transduction histidine kinase
MLHEFLTENRTLLIEMTRAKVAKRRSPKPTAEELEKGVPLFLDQLSETLRLSTKHVQLMTVSASMHGGVLHDTGFTIAQVVHDYGDICQAVTELADQTRAPITTDEFRTLNRCLDDAIAEAVTEFVRRRDLAQGRHESERLGVLAHEIRNSLTAATLAYQQLQSGTVGMTGSTAMILGRSLRDLRDLVDRSLAEVRLEAGAQNKERISISTLLEELEAGAALEASARGIAFSVASAPRELEVEGDRPILMAALFNVLQNAFKFSHADGHVALRTAATAHHVVFEIEDSCGGLPNGKAEDLFRPFTQSSTNRQGVGLGLFITRKGIETFGGSVSVRDLPGKGCAFTIELPRYVAPSVDEAPAKRTGS